MYSFKPAVCDGQKYDGTVSIRSLSFDERLDIYEELGLDEMPADDSQQKKAGLRVIKAIGKKSKDFVKAVDITRLSDGYKYQSWDEIYYDADMTALVVEVCTKILGKLQAGT